ncbi:MAG: sigma-70 family RNA polymerase sigma factor, partial [Planctomycetota bacterium]
MKPNSPIDARFEEYLESGSARALADVFERAAPALLRVGASAGLDRPSAEDALQECFLVIVRRRAQYDRSRPFMGWASGIMALQSRQAQRRLRRERDLVARLTRDLGPDETLSVEALDDEAREQVVRALRPLPREQRDVLQLRFVEGLAPAEIARRLGIRPNAEPAAMIPAMPRAVTVSATVDAMAPTPIEVGPLPSASRSTAVRTASSPRAGRAARTARSAPSAGPESDSRSRRVPRAIRADT